MPPPHVHVSTRILPDGQRHAFNIDSSAPLQDVLMTGLESAGLSLNPPPSPPLDRLFPLLQHGAIGPVIDDLDAPVGPFVAGRATNDFGIELVLAIRVNAQWRIAPQTPMTPRQILTLFELNPQEYSLYPARSATLLPPDTPVPLTRGLAFEAQRDGKYGATTTSVMPARMAEEVAELAELGVPIEGIDDEGSQPYVLARNRPAPTPPWGQPTNDILIAVPLAYDQAGLDAFYIGLPYTYQGALHPKAGGATITIRKQQWQLVSWHYPDGKSWVAGLDCLQTHLTHCDGFFLGRGAINS